MADTENTYRAVTPYLLVPDADDALTFTDVDATYATALRAGATSQHAPEDMPYGHRNAGVIDRNGIPWWIAAAVKTQGTSQDTSTVQLVS